MRERIENVIAGIKERHSDRRLHAFSVAVDAVEGKRAKLSGRVLERTNLELIRKELDDFDVDDSAVTVLRRSPAVTRVVATNMTDLHVEPSFLSEMLTQSLNGTRLEILEERDKWAFVRQDDGYMGWAYRGFLADADPVKATHIVTVPAAAIYAEGVKPPEPLSRLMAGTPVEVTRVEHDCVFVRVAGEMLPKGWVPRQFLRPIDSLPLSADAAREQIVADARQFRGVYYLWGGNTGFGTDCSGLAQLAHRLSGYTLPRDADMQFAAGKPVNEPYRAGDLLFFWNEARTKIGHVGIVIDGWKIIHSSRGRNGVYEEDVQESETLRNGFAGARSFL